MLTAKTQNQVIPKHLLTCQRSHTASFQCTGNRLHLEHKSSTTTHRLPSQEGESVHPARHRQHRYSAALPHIPPFHPHSPPGTLLTLFRTVSQLQEHEELQYSRITPRASGQPSPPTPARSTALGERQAGFHKHRTAAEATLRARTASTAVCWRAWVAAIFSVPWRHRSQKSWPRGC